MQEAKAQVLRERRALKRMQEEQALRAAEGLGDGSTVSRAEADQPTRGMRLPPQARDV